MWRSLSAPQIHQKYIYMSNNSYRTPTEPWQKASDIPKSKKLPMYLGRAKEKRKKNGQKIGTDLLLWEGAVKEEKFPHTRKPLHWWRRGWWGDIQSHGREHSNRGLEGKAKIFPHRRSVPTSTHLPEMLICSPTRAGGAGIWGLGCGGQTPGRGLGLAAWRQPEGD